MITIAIPLYNGEKYIRDTLHSIIRQTIGVATVIIIDDASTDKSFEIINEIKSQENVTNFQYVKNEINIGYLQNWNKCFNLCATKYLIILHQDDVLKTNAVHGLFNFLSSHPDVALVGGGEDFIDEYGQIIVTRKPGNTRLYNTGEIYEFVTNQNSYIACSSVMFDMEKVQNVGYFDTDVIGADELYWPKVLMKYPIAILGESLIFRRIHPEQTEYKDFILLEKQSLEIHRKFYRILEYEQREQYKISLKLFLDYKFASGWIGIVATNVAKQGYFFISIKYIIRAIRINPSIIFHFPKMWKSFAKMLVYLFRFYVKKINHL